MTRVALQQQQQFRASVCSWQGVSTNVIRDTKLLWQTAHKLSSMLKSVKEIKLYVQPPEGSPKLLQDGRRVVWKVRKAMLSLQTSPRRWQEDLSKKLKEHGFIQDERDPCLFANTELDGHLHRGACGRHAGSGTQ